MGGDHELKFGLSYSYIPLHFRSASNENGTFVFGHDLAFNASNPRTYPERLQIRLPGVSRTTRCTAPTSAAMRRTAGRSATT